MKAKISSLLGYAISGSSYQRANLGSGRRCPDFFGHRASSDKSHKPGSGPRTRANSADDLGVGDHYCRPCNEDADTIGHTLATNTAVSPKLVNGSIGCRFPVKEKSGWVNQSLRISTRSQPSVPCRSSSIITPRIDQHTRGYSGPQTKKQSSVSRKNSCKRCGRQKEIFRDKWISCLEHLLSIARQIAFG